MPDQAPRRVNPAEARKGLFVETFPLDEFSEMIRTAIRYQKIADWNTHRLAAQKVEIVYTRMNIWGKGGDTWQIYCLRKQA